MDVHGDEPMEPQDDDEGEAGLIALPDDLRTVVSMTPF